MALSALKWCWSHKVRLGMITIVMCGYILRKFFPHATEELKVLDELWAIIAVGAVFVPNFSQTQVEP